ncbi:hypothetical protein ACLMJK_006385 [Lecanora helva]
MRIYASLLAYPILMIIVGCAPLKADTSLTQRSLALGERQDEKGHFGNTLVTVFSSVVKYTDDVMEKRGDQDVDLGL